MKNLALLSVLALFVLSSMAGAADSPLKVSFLEACDNSPHIDEGSSCMCVYNEVIHQFGEDDAMELIPFVNGDQEMEKEVGDSLAFIGGKCED